MFEETSILFEDLLLPTYQWGTNIRHTVLHFGLYSNNFIPFAPIVPSV